MKTWKKRVPALLLALVMCLSLLPTAALAADEGDFTIENGKLTKYNGPGGDVVIPEGVTNIGRLAFYNCTSLTSVTVPYGVTQITDYAFDGCTNLSRVTLPDSLDHVGTGAFSNCPSLDELVIPDSVTRYTNSASNSVRKLTFGSGIADPLRDGQSGWLMDNKNLTSLTIRGRVQSIDRSVFTTCRNLTEIHYSGTVQEWRDALDAGALKTVYDPNAYSNAMWCIPNATVYCSDGTIAPGTANKPGSTPDSGATDPTPQSGTLTLHRGPDSDSVDLSAMDYPANLYCYPTLVVGGAEVPASSYHVTYSWSLTGLGARPMNNSTSDKYNYCEIYCPYASSGLRLTCNVTAQYNGQSYTASTSWDGIYRSADYNGSGSSTDRSQVVITFDSQGGSPVDSITVTAGQTYGVLPTPTRPGYKFVCWMTRGNVGVNANTKVDPIGTQTLYAYWEEDSGTTSPANPANPANPDTPTNPTTPANPVTAAFSDVPEDAYYAAPVSWALEKNITNGTSDTRFSPGEDCTQVQILTFLYRAARGGGTAAAEDMGHAVNWARDKGIIDGSFNGGTPCTRATAVTYIWKAFGQPSAGGSSFSDVPAGSACAGAVSWAVQQEVTNGTSATTFSPGDVCSRGQIVTFLYRAYH